MKEGEREMVSPTTQSVLSSTKIVLDPLKAVWVRVAMTLLGGTP